MCSSKTHSEVHIGIRLSDTFLILNCLKQEIALLPFIFNISLEYEIRKVQDSQIALKLNRTHQFLVYVDYMNLLGDNMNNIEKNNDDLIDDIKKVALEVNTQKAKYMLMYRHQNAGQNHDIKTANTIL
jgi:hypothetical protein